MKIFLSGLESNTGEMFEQCYKNGTTIPFGLVSYYYVQSSTKGHESFEKAMCLSDHVLVDSGAHSFQKGKTVDWLGYTHRYAEWIKQHDQPKILGFFEMDVDNRLGYAKVLEMRKILDAASKKIIPVWHKNRGIAEFKRMCHETPGNIVAITGFHNEDIKDVQYGAFLKYAWQCGKKVHCLGMTRTKVLDKVPFNYVDSSSWKQAPLYGQIRMWNAAKHKMVLADGTRGKFKTDELFYPALKETLKQVRYYNVRWSKINHDLYF